MTRPVLSAGVAVCLLSAAIALAVPVSAADMGYPVKAPPPKAATGFNWTGFHAGANLGYGGGDFSYPFNVSAFGGRIAGDLALSSGGMVGGGQFGYDHQFDNGLVLGLEADLQWSGVDGDLVANGNYAASIGIPALADVDATTSIDWFGTLRARAGYGWDRVLVYATGGAAYGKVAWQADVALSAPGFGFVDTIRADDIQWGWTAGAGVEYALTDLWVLRAEYLFVDLGTQTLSLSPNPILTGSVDVQTGLHLGRVAVNYKF